MAMANILQSLGDATAPAKHENNMEVLIYTRPGMIVLGEIFAGAAGVWPQIVPETDNTNSIVIDMSDF